VAARPAKDFSKDSVKESRTVIQQKFERLGLRVPYDFVLHLPLRYEDETAVIPIQSLRGGMTAQVEGEVLDSEVKYKPRRQLTATIRDDTGTLYLRWLTFYPSQQQQMKAGRRWRIRGEVRSGFNGFEIIHPKVTAPSSPLPASLTPVYPTTDGLSQPSLRKAIVQAIEQVQLDDTLPEALVRRIGLLPFSTAIKILHAPTPDLDPQALIDHTHPAWTRVKFDELLAQQLSLAAARDARRTKKAGHFRSIHQRKV